MRLVQNKVLSLLGLATRARKSVSGEFSVEKAVKEGKAQLVIVAGMHRRIQRSSSEICVLIIEYRFIFFVVKQRLGMRWD